MYKKEIQFYIYIYVYLCVYIYIYIYIYIKLFFQLGCYRILSRVSYAIQ